ncbi:MAG: disulfide bond formation protein B [Pseudomonadota bacterium]
MVGGLSRRGANFAAFGVCAALTAYALYQQFVVGLEPCHLCILQRVGIVALGLVFLAAALQNPGATGARVYAVLLGLVALATAGTAARHVWIQQQPAGSVPACGADLDFMLEIMPLHEVLVAVFTGGGECQKIDWSLFGLSMPAWVLMAAVAIGGFGLWANLRNPRAA